MGNKKRISLKRKRTFRGNQWNKTPTLEDDNVKHVSVSASKVFLEKVDNNSNAENYNIIINFSILRKVIDSICSCPECNSCIAVTDDNDKRSGFYHKLNFKCTKCKFQYCNFTSGSVKKTVPKQGRNYFDINLRMVITFREIGKGHQALVDLARIANTSCMNKNAFNKINNTIQNVYKLSAEQSTKAAAIKVKNKAKEEHIGSGKK